MKRGCALLLTLLLLGTTGQRPMCSSSRRTIFTVPMRKNVNTSIEAIRPMEKRGMLRSIRAEIISAKGDRG